eukprot:Lithocolla_globosa_v1_NODE_578_length_3693_cov_3.312259.p4 type:complete len:102 gc:universal NODE_578_length_3693_cov_3.312259:3319-3624(+)
MQSSTKIPIFFSTCLKISVAIFSCQVESIICVNINCCASTEQNSFRSISNFFADCDKSSSIKVRWISLIAESRRRIASARDKILEIQSSLSLVKNLSGLGF